MIKQLSETESALLRVGALMMVVGAGTWLWWKEPASVVYAIGAALFMAMMARASYEGQDFVARRLRLQQMLGSILFFISSLLLLGQTFAGHNFFRYNEWVVCLLVGAVVVLYSTMRLASVLESKDSSVEKKSGKYSNCLLLALLCVMTASCSDQYMLNGSTTVHGMEGKMLYLKVYRDNDLTNLDSAYVQHGKFLFKGSMDTIVMANLFMGTQSLMPVVLESGNIELKIDEITQSVTGTPLNDTLYNFIQRKTQIDNLLAELPRREGRMVMDGMEHEEVMTRLGVEARRLTQEGDQLVTSFIKRNYTNVLGPGIFMIMTSEYAYPVLTPQIEELTIGAPSYFLEHPYVKEYLRVAQENMEKLQQQ